MEVSIARRKHQPVHYVFCTPTRYVCARAKEKGRNSISPSDLKRLSNTRTESITAAVV